MDVSVICGLYAQNSKHQGPQFRRLQTAALSLVWRQTYNLPYPPNRLRAGGLVGGLVDCNPSSTLSPCWRGNSKIALLFGSRKTGQLQDSTVWQQTAMPALPQLIARMCTLWHGERPCARRLVKCLFNLNHAIIRDWTFLHWRTKAGAPMPASRPNIAVKYRGSAPSFFHPRPIG